MENESPKPNCFKPTKRKLILPIVFLLLPLTLFLLGVPYLQYIGLAFAFLLLFLCTPFYPLLQSLGQTETVGWFDMGGGPTLAGLILVLVIYAVIFYLLGCLFAYLRNKSGLNQDLRLKINQNPKITILFIIFLLVIAGVLLIIYFYKVPSPNPRGPLPQITPPAADTQAQDGKFLCASADDQWCTFTNQKYNYTFQFPRDCRVSNQIQLGRGGTQVIKDNFVIMASVPDREKERGFGIHITVSHTDTEFFNPPAGTDLVSWLNQKAGDQYRNYPIPHKPNLEIDGLPAVYIDLDSPQSGHQADAYVLKDTQLFQINAIDVSTPEARAFFQEFLATFRFEN